MFYIKQKFRMISLTAFIIILSHVEFGDSKALKSDQDDEMQFTINLKAQAVVVGPEITLGDIGHVVVQDSSVKTRLASLRIGNAPPPGESSEITLNEIKRRLRKAGFGRFVDGLRGPRIIRVTTAQTEIDKAFIKEEYAAALFDKRSV